MIVIGLFAVITDGHSVLNYTWIVVGLLQAGTYFYDKKYQYLTIENNTLTKHFLVPKSIKISEIRRIIKLMYSYKVETETGTMRISKNLIEENSLKELDRFFDRLKLN